MAHSYRDDPETGDFPGERSCGSTGLRYVLEGLEGDCGSLVLPFAAAHDPGEPARYYTHRVLRELPCPRLFVLDDQGPGDPARPCWYLGRLPELEVARAVIELVERLAGELGSGRLITCGSSMGGWAAAAWEPPTRSRASRRSGSGLPRAGDSFRHRAPHRRRHPARRGPGDARRPGVRGLPRGAGAAAHPSVQRPHSPSGARRASTRPCELERSDHLQHVPDLGLRFLPFLRSRLDRLLAGDRSGTQ